MLNEPTGIWDCTRCFECVTACPKGVAPMDRIMALRDQAISAGFDNTYGARHAEGFAELVEHSGWLDELRIVPKTVGMANIPALLHLAPEALRALTHGKLPPIIHKKIEDVASFRKVFKNADEAPKE